MSAGTMVNLSDSKQPDIYGTISTVCPVAVLVVVLRLLARRVSKAGYWWDDWIIIIAMVECTHSKVRARLVHADL